MAAASDSGTDRAKPYGLAGAGRPLQQHPRSAAQRVAHPSNVLLLVGA